MVRKNGFDYPFHPTQLFSWFEFALSQTILILIFSKSLSNAVLLTLNLISSILVVYWTIAITNSDPTFKGNDVAILFSKHRKTFLEKDLTYNCDICNHKTPPEAKHCGTCNRCAIDIDHHCTWLNNCISLHNYRQFFTLIILFSL